jgi:hypothetical protein
MPYWALMDQCGMCPIEPCSSILCLMVQYWALRLNIVPWGSIGHVSYWASRLNIETWVSLLSLKAQYWAPRLNIDPQGSILSSEAQYWDSRLNNEPQGSIGDSCLNRTLVSYWDSSPIETRHLQTGLMPYNFHDSHPLASSMAFVWTIPCSLSAVSPISG